MASKKATKTLKKAKALQHTKPLKLGGVKGAVVSKWTPRSY